MTSCNRWRVLRLLCRICTDQVSDLTEWGREALCQLALLLGPQGLREHRLPILSSAGSTSITSAALRPHHHRGYRWRRFGRPHHHHHRGRNVMSSVTEIAAASGGALDIARITAPLRSVTASRRAGGGKALTRPEVLVTA